MRFVPCLMLFLLSVASAIGCSDETHDRTGQVPGAVLSILKEGNTGCVNEVAAIGIFDQLEDALVYMDAVTGWKPGKVIQLTPAMSLILEDESLNFSNDATSFTFFRERILQPTGTATGTIRTTATIKNVATVVSDFSIIPLGDKNQIESVTFYSCETSNLRFVATRTPTSSHRPLYARSLSSKTGSQTASFEVSDNPSDDNTYHAQYCLDGQCSQVEITDDHRSAVLSSYGRELDPDTLVPQWYLRTISFINQ